MSAARVVMEGAWYALDGEALKRGNQNIVAIAPTLKEARALSAGRDVVMYWSPPHEAAVSYDSSYWRGA